MNEPGDQPRFGHKIPIIIAVVSVATVLGAVIVTLHSPVEPIAANEGFASPPETVQPSTSSAAAPVAAARDRRRNVSVNLAGPLREAQEAIRSGNYADAIEKLEAADSTPAKFPYDQHVINALLSAAYVHMKDYRSAARVLEAQLNDGFLSPSDTTHAIAATALVNYQLQNYDKAIEFGNRLIGSPYVDPHIPIVVAQSYYLKGDWGDAERVVGDFVGRQSAAGGIPGKESLLLWEGACVKLHDDGCETRALEQLVTYYPTPLYQQELDRLRATR